MKKIIIISAVIFLGAALAVIASLEDVQYPVAELGNCQNEGDCESFCNKEENMKACLDFAEKYQLISSEEIDMGKRMLETGKSGPGGCKSKAVCEAYCDKTENMKECISFAKENNLIPADELAEAEKVLAAIERGAVAPPCKGKKDCDEYCAQSAETMKKCIQFGKEAGLMSAEELQDIDKMLQALDKGVAPLPCSGKEACDQFCSKSENIDRCAEFMLAAGFMKPEEAEMFRKTGGKGPGNCSGKEECESFCNNPENQKTCFEFAKQYGLISEEDLKQMEAGQEQMKQSLNQASPEVIECLKTNFGQDVVEKIQAGEFMPPREDEDKIRQCFEQFMGSQGPEGQTPQQGPGGMTNPTEGMPGGQAPVTGPGGCTSQEECQNYCSQNPSVCQQFAPSQGATPLPQEGTQTYPTGPMPPPEGTQTPPEGTQLPPPGDYQSPAQPMPPSEFSPPPPTETQPSTESAPPSSYKAMENFLANLINIFSY